MKYSKATLDQAAYIEKHCTSCSRCMKDCLFLKAYCETPKELFQQFLEEDLEPIVPYSCQLCGRCTVVCPLQLELGEAFLSMRRDLIKEKKLPLKRLRSIKMHQRLSMSRWFTATNRGEKK